MVQNLNSCQESEQDESSEVNSSDSSYNSDNSPSYDILYGAYVEMHEELKKLAKNYMNKKRLILELEKKISELQSFIDELNLENETLDLIYANSSCNCTTKLTETPTCKNCNVLNAENSVLKNKIAKFTYSSHNLDNLLAASRNVGVLLSKMRKAKFKNLKKGQRRRNIWQASNILIRMGNDPFYAENLQAERVAMFLSRNPTYIRYANMTWFAEEGFSFAHELEAQGTTQFLELQGCVYPSMIREFYAKFQNKNGEYISLVKGKLTVLNAELFLAVGELASSAAPLGDCNNDK
ncbi:hypothetical protein Lal_00037529 [Lupinus albus]|nr:hypothetical protein Lal_00037529 [Lupinus albus]